MRVNKNALCYAALSSQRPSSDAHWLIERDEARALSEEAFDEHARALCAAAEAVRTTRNNDGTRTQQRLQSRLRARSDEVSRRSALDLQRLSDLEDRMRLRQAQSERQRWFVLGRLLAAAAREDGRWQGMLDALITRTPLSKQEQKILGVARCNGR